MTWANGLSSALWEQNLNRGKYPEFACIGEHVTLTQGQIEWSIIRPKYGHMRKNGQRHLTRTIPRVWISNFDGEMEW